MDFLPWWLVGNRLGWTFHSIRRAGLILAMLPFNIAAGFVAFGLAGLHLSISAAVGLIAVAGIPVQNGVITVEEVVRLVDNDVSLVRAVTEGAI